MAAKKQQAAAQFDAMHGALASEAHAAARELGVDVTTVAFRPDGGGAVSHEFLGVAPEERIRRLIAADVSAMGPAELARHAARLQALRAALARKLSAGKEKEGVDGDVVQVIGSAPGHKETQDR